MSKHDKNPTKCVGLIQSGHHHHLINMYLVLTIDKNLVASQGRGKEDRAVTYYK
jgi:hypothetical protein